MNLFGADPWENLIVFIFSSPRASIQNHESTIIYALWYFFHHLVSIERKNNCPCDAIGPPKYGYFELPICYACMNLKKKRRKKWASTSQSVLLVFLSLLISFIRTHFFQLFSSTFLFIFFLASFFLWFLVRAFFLSLILRIVIFSPASFTLLIIFPLCLLGLYFLFYYTSEIPTTI